MSGELARIDLATFIAALEEAGCQPQQVSESLWFSLCPACKAEGRSSLLEIQVLPDGSVNLDGC